MFLVFWVFFSFAPFLTVKLFTNQTTLQRWPVHEESERSKGEEDQRKQKKNIKLNGELREMKTVWEEEEECGGEE